MFIIADNHFGMIHDIEIQLPGRLSYQDLFPEQKIGQVNGPAAFKIVSVEDKT